MPVPASELDIETVREGTSAIDMAQAIFGNGVTVTGASYRGDIDSAGTYSGGDATSPGVAPGDKSPRSHLGAKKGGGRAKCSRAIVWGWGSI